MSSTSTSESTSVSSPVVTETKENGLIDSLSGVAAGLANQMNNWAQSVYAQTSAVTDQVVGNFMNASQQMMGLAGNMTNQYNNLFAPENANLVRDADNYASTARQQLDMGQAGATQAQAGNQAIKNSEANLASMGIDPSSGRYAALDKAAAVQNAANVAGAENMQRNQDIQTGQALRSEAVQVGAQLPAAISNATNTALQANTGASNATLANANTGANLNSLADKYLSTAMNIKLPLQGQASSSQSSSHGSSDRGGGSGSGAGGGNGGGSGAGPGTTWSGMAPNTAAMATGGGASGVRGQPNSSIMGVPAYGGTDWGLGASDMANGQFDYLNNDNIYQPDAYGSSASMGDPTTSGLDYLNSNDNPYADSGFGQTFDYGGNNSTFNDMGGGTNTEWGNISYDPAANNQGAASDWANTYDTPSWPGDSSGGGSTDNSGAFNDYGMSNDTSATYDPSSSDSSSYDSGSYDSSYGYAGGGMIPPDASPSGGQVTDDVRAQVPPQRPGVPARPINVNAGEFVVPKDVARWKGEEFMHNLIAQSRKKRMQMQAALGTGGKPMPQPQRPMTGGR